METSLSAQCGKAHPCINCTLRNGNKIPPFASRFLWRINCTLRNGNIEEPAPIEEPARINCTLRNGNTAAAKKISNDPTY